MNDHGVCAEHKTINALGKAGRISHNAPLYSHCAVCNGMASQKKKKGGLKWGKFSKASRTRPGLLKPRHGPTASDTDSRNTYDHGSPEN